jgi:hypothetical protein
MVTGDIVTGDIMQKGDKESCKKANEKGHSIRKKNEKTD